MSRRSEQTNNMFKSNDIDEELDNYTPEEDQCCIDDTEEMELVWSWDRLEEMWQ